MSPTCERRVESRTSGGIGRRNAEAGEILRFSNDALVDRSVMVDLVDFGECLVDENDRDEDRKALLREPRDVLNERRKFESDYDQKSDHHPESDPEAKGHKVPIVLSVKQVNGNYSTSTKTQSVVCTGDNRGEQRQRQR